MCISIHHDSICMHMYTRVYICKHAIHMYILQIYTVIYTNHQDMHIMLIWANISPYLPDFSSRPNGLLGMAPQILSWFLCRVTTASQQLLCLKPYMLQIPQTSNMVNKNKQKQQSVSKGHHVVNSWSLLVARLLQFGKIDDFRCSVWNDVWFCWSWDFKQTVEID